MREPPSLPRAALDQLDPLYNLARSLTGDDDAAADLVQETFARAFRAAAQFDAGTNLRAWLFRILRNLVVDDWRRSRSSPITLCVDDEPAQAGDGGREPLRGDEELDLLRRVVAEDISRALDTLSLDARTVVLLDLEGLSHDEIAEVVGCELGTVKSRLSRARAALRVRLQEYAR